MGFSGNVSAAGLLCVLLSDLPGSLCSGSASSQWGFCLPCYLLLFVMEQCQAMLLHEHRVACGQETQSTMLCLGSRGQLSSQLLQGVYQKMPQTLCCRTRRVLGWKLSQIIPKFQFMLATFWIQISPVWDKTHVSTITPSLFALWLTKAGTQKGAMWHTAPCLSSVWQEQHPGKHHGIYLCHSWGVSTEAVHCESSRLIQLIKFPKIWQGERYQM